MKKAVFFCAALCIVINVFSQKHWDTLGPRINNIGNDAPNVIYADSNYLYMAGLFTEVSGEHMQGIARWNGIKWDSMGTGIDGIYYLTGNIIPNNMFAMISYHNKLYVGGQCISLGNVTAYGMGVWDGTKWDSMPIPPFTCDSLHKRAYSSGTIDAMDTINNKLYIGGGFDTVADFPCNSIAYWDGSNWHSMNFPYFSSYQSINAICAYKGSIYAGGSFAGQNGSIGEILRWDSTGWHAVDTGIKGASAWILSMSVYKGELYVAGYFSTSDGNADNNIQRWDGTQWKAVGGGTDGEVFSLTVYNNKLYAMGEISTAGGIPANSIAEWDGTKWCSLGSTFDNTIGTACVYKDSLYIGGGFRTIDRDSISYIAEWTGGDYSANCSPAGVSEVKGESEEVKAYPNPSNAVFQLEITNEKFEINNKIEVYNVLGQQVYQSNINSDNTEINLSGQPNGIYLYRVTTLTGSLVGEGKLVKQ